MLSSLSCRIKESSPAEQTGWIRLFFRMFHRCDDHGENPSFTRRTDNITQKRTICKFNYTKNIYLLRFDCFSVKKKEDLPDCDTKKAPRF